MAMMHMPGQGQPLIFESTRSKNGSQVDLEPVQGLNFETILSPAKFDQRRVGAALPEFCSAHAQTPSHALVNFMLQTLINIKVRKRLRT